MGPLRHPSSYRCITKHISVRISSSSQPWGLLTPGPPPRPALLTASGGGGQGGVGRRHPRHLELGALDLRQLTYYLSVHQGPLYCAAQVRCRDSSRELMIQWNCWRRRGTERGITSAPVPPHGRQVGVVSSPTLMPMTSSPAPLPPGPARHSPWTWRLPQPGISPCSLVVIGATVIHQPLLCHSHGL